MRPGSAGRWRRSTPRRPRPSDLTDGRLTLDDVELAIDARHVEDAADGAAAVHDSNAAALLAGARVGPQDQAQPGRVHEVQSAEVDDQLGPLLALGADQLVVEAS